ncbi:UNKNOWN [Stylonychia lemnae]|uniref:Uncharacterized protein n=1 Tax=Stylonychia lemnae TaxID=5949 RepID=A0A078ALX4_STYLE|nr:UNKNOWN [Stylonychia lemnae]|eukprot:CDW82392.1 UNKNOWN [Stylonychia lemnae]
MLHEKSKLTQQLESREVPITAMPELPRPLKQTRELLKNDNKHQLRNNEIIYDHKYQVEHKIFGEDLEKIQETEETSHSPKMIIDWHKQDQRDDLPTATLLESKTHESKTIRENRNKQKIVNQNFEESDKDNMIELLKEDLNPEENSKDAVDYNKLDQVFEEEPKDESQEIKVVNPDTDALLENIEWAQKQK